MIIASEERAHQIGREKSPGGYVVFHYKHRHTNLTLFGVELPDGRFYTTDPRAAAPRNIEGE